MLIEKFITQVKKTPGKTAVKIGEKIFTYAELDNYADRIAGAIESVWPAQVEKAQVGLLLDHGVEMIAAILGVLKAGKVYVPLSTGYPLNRISYMLEDSNSGLVIIDSKCTEKTKEMILAKHIGFLNIDEIGENSLNFAFHSKMGGKNAED
ncbi:MAG TPA: AMP-binding protein, partial [Candidatus Deferrimicrobium sp.]|nr:AMP-binding protein [Candidatus Deferrimicrobium sp.]